MELPLLLNVTWQHVRLLGKNIGTWFIVQPCITGNMNRLVKHIMQAGSIGRVGGEWANYKRKGSTVLYERAVRAYFLLEQRSSATPMAPRIYLSLTVTTNPWQKDPNLPSFQSCDESTTPNTCATYLKGDMICGSYTSFGFVLFFKKKHPTSKDRQATPLLTSDYLSHSYQTASQHVPFHFWFTLTPFICPFKQPW